LFEEGSSIDGSWVGVVGLKSSNLDVILCGDWIIDLRHDDGDKAARSWWFKG